MVTKIRNFFRNFLLMVDDFKWWSAAVLYEEERKED